MRVIPFPKADKKTQFLCPINDYLFVKFATEPQYRHFFSHCMRSFLDPENHHPNETFSLDDPRLIPDRFKGKKNFCDVHFANNSDDRIVVEMQRKNHTAFFEATALLAIPLVDKKSAQGV